MISYVYLLHFPPELIESMMNSLGGGQWQCNECGYQSRNKTNLKYHIEAKHMSASDISTLYPCPHCDKFLKNRKALNNHLHKYHRNMNILE